MNMDEVNSFVDLMMEDETLEDFLERFNISRHEVIEYFINSGMIDIEDMKELSGYG